MMKSRGMYRTWSTHGEKSNAYRFLMVKPEGKYHWEESEEENIKMDLREIGWNGMDWIDLAQDRDQWWDLVNTVTNLRFL
jgi:hypothetical protein